MTNPAPALYIAAASAVEAVSDGAPKKRIHLMPLGKIECRDIQGKRGPYMVRDRAAAEAIVAETKRRLGRTSMMIDYDHGLQHLVRGRSNTAIAAGWIDPATLIVEDDGIYGEAEWTPAAATALSNREYRYLSPFFFVDPATSEVRSLVNAALVNLPAIEALDAVAAAQAAAGGDHPEYEMDLTKIAVAAGLAASATEGEIVTKVTALAGTAAALVAASQKLGLQAGAGVEQLVAAAATPNPAEYAPVSVVTSLQADIAQLKAAIDGDKAEQAVAAAMQAGKISPGMKDWADDYAKSNLAGFADYVAAAPVIVAAGAQYQRLSDPAEGGSAILTPEEKAVAASMGLTDEAFIAAKKEA